eukprot:gene4558-10082_t
MRGPPCGAVFAALFVALPLGWDGAQATLTEDQQADALRWHNKARSENARNKPQYCMGENAAFGSDIKDAVYTSWNLGEECGLGSCTLS